MIFDIHEAGRPHEVAGNEAETHQYSISDRSPEHCIGLDEDGTAFLDDRYVAHRNSFESFTEHDVMALTSTL